MIIPSVPEPGEHLFRTSDGFLLDYFVRGSGPPLIILPPAWGIGSFYLQDGLADLEEKFTLIYLEFRSNAKSTRRNSEVMTSWHLADDVEALRQELKLDTIPRLMGHSGGGTTALWYAIRYPEKVDSLVLLNHQLEDFDDTQSMGVILAQKRDDPRFHDALEAWTSSWDDLSDFEFAETIKKFLPVYFYDPSRASASPLATLKEAPLWNYQMLHGKYRRVKCQEENLEKVKARTLMIFSREDPICTPTQGEATKQGIEGSKLVVLEKCGHFPWMEKKEQTLDEITQFFEEK
ncbi:hypothetical protein BHE90_001526 [Fusarium euwallaceae]|uniref:AB hydrolase-1 domain-containing protein n=1 Tax=Fusarium euwallaceae TaxID=1147111 RepID=A0A430M7I4_9HYPO|nr:hypothetical protein BHE90_001526 [Fusarium euwallaceae]